MTLTPSSPPLLTPLFVVLPLHHGETSRFQIPTTYHSSTVSLRSCKWWKACSLTIVMPLQMLNNQCLWWVSHLKVTQSINQSIKEVYHSNISIGMGKSTFCCEWLPTVFKSTSKFIITKFVFQDDFNVEDLEQQYTNIMNGTTTTTTASSMGSAFLLRCKFLNILHQAYQSQNCLGLSVRDLPDIFHRYKGDPSACGEVMLKVALMAHICSKYGNFVVAYRGCMTKIPHFTALQIDAQMQLGRFGTCLPLFEKPPASWNDVCNFFFC